jgi:hypothetical protein
MMEADVGNTPQLEAPTLAHLSSRMDCRPLWAIEDPFEVDANTFQTARSEMVEIQRRRGFPVASAAIDRPNFLLRGVPVVMADG